MELKDFELMEVNLFDVLNNLPKSIKKIFYRISTRI